MSGAGERGTVEAIFAGPVPEQVPASVQEAEVIAGRGIRGDRYFAETGTFSETGASSEPRKPGRDLTLVEAEAIEALAAEHGIEIEPAESRRNVLTRGIGLNALVGRRFRVGEVECRGDRLCDPCSHLEGLTKPGVLKGLVNRGGLRADVLAGGTIRPGDEVVPLD